MTSKTLNKMKTNNSWFSGKEIRGNHSPGAQERQADTGKCSLFEQPTGRTLWNYCQNGQLLTCWRLSVAKECRLLDHPVGGRPPSCLLCHQLSPGSSKWIVVHITTGGVRGHFEICQRISLDFQGLTSRNYLTKPKYLDFLSF